MRVADVMTRKPLVARPGMSLKEAAQLMLSAGVSGLPVVDLDDALVGIVTEADFVEQEAARDGSRSFRMLDIVAGRAAKPYELSGLVGDVMSVDLVVVGPAASVAEAARLMTANKVKRLLVVDRHNELVGILSRADILEAFARPDHELCAEIEAVIANEGLDLGPDSVRVAVHDGAVRLCGSVETKSEAAALAEFIRHFVGVVKVETYLGWEVDDTEAVERFAGYPREGMTV